MKVLELETSETMELVSWPLKVASAVALPMSTFLLLAFPLSLFYSFSYNNYDSTTAGVVHSLDEESEDCEAEVIYSVGGKLYQTTSDCIRKVAGQEVTVRYKSDDPMRSTTKGPLFSFFFIPVLGGFLTLFGLWLFMNCFKFVRDLFVHKAVARHTLHRLRTEDLIHDEYNEEDWYAEQEAELAREQESNEAQR